MRQYSAQIDCIWIEEGDGESQKGDDDMIDLLTAGNFAGAIGFLFAALTAIILHELAHGYAAMKNGDYTPKMYGRMTLNPLKHFDPFGFCLFLFVGFGWARPVPVNPSNFRSYRKGMFWVSVAGVLTNLVLAFFSVPLYYLCQILYVQFQSVQFLTFLLLVLQYYFLFMALINISLMVFNLLPVAPLDGFRIIQSFTRPWNRFVQFMERYGSAILIGLVLLSFIMSRTPGLNFSLFGTISGWVLTPIELFWRWVFGLFGI